jgi:hypothetical protein
MASTQSQHRSRKNGGLTKLLALEHPGAETRFEIKKSKSRAGGTAGAAVHPKTTDPTSWEVEVP